MLKPKQVKYIELCLRKDMTDKERAAEINISQKTICEWKKQPEFAEEYKKAVERRINYASAAAANKMIKLMEEAESENVSLQAAKEILDRSGLKAREEISIKTENPYQELTTAELKALIGADKLE